MVQVASANKSLFGFSSVSHFFASVLGDLQKACVFAEKAASAISANAGVVESISGLLPGIGSQAVLLERAAFSALGLVVSAVHATGAAAGESGINLTLDQATVRAFEDLINGCKSDLEQMGYKI